MNIEIRNHIFNNFKDASKNDIKNSINDSIKDGDEITLPGLGVFFELIWTNSTEKEKDKIINTIDTSIKKEL